MGPNVLVVSMLVLKIAVTLILCSNVELNIVNMSQCIVGDC